MHASKYDDSYNRTADDTHVGRWVNSLQCDLPNPGIYFRNDGDLTYTTFFFKHQLAADCLPAPVSDLTAAAGYSIAAVAWTSSGDDGMIGQAQVQELRYATFPINAGNYTSAGVVSVPPPGPPGTPHCVLVAVSPCATTYFAVRTRDETLWSELSNIASATASCSPGPNVGCAGAQMTVAPELHLDESLPLTVEFSAGANPANGPTSIAFGVPSSRAHEALEICVFDLAGRRIRTLQHGLAVPGRHHVEWDLRTDAGAMVHSGPYFLSLQIGKESHARKLLIVR
jgi:hypothetical protein